MKKSVNLKGVAKALFLLSFLPLMAFAATVDSILLSVRTTLNYVIAILFVLVTIYFIWGIIQYITAGGKEEQLAQGKKHMIWGIVGMAVMGAAWGIVGIIWNYLGISGGGNVPIPTI